MKRLLNIALALSIASAFITTDLEAAPAAPGALLPAIDAGSMVEQARTFCYNRYTGRFLYWGHCRRRVVYRRPGRVYCYNRRTGRFLHWGAC